MNSDDTLYKIDGVLWQIYDNEYAEPVCPDHHMVMEGFRVGFRDDPELSHTLKCDDCENCRKLPRNLSREREYVVKKIASKRYKSMSVLNIDGESTPIAKDELRLPGNSKWVECKLVDSKFGPSIVIYAGDRNRKDKTQLFVDPQNKRIGFDHNDHHPSEIFAIVEATFLGGSSASIRNTADLEHDAKASSDRTK